MGELTSRQTLRTGVLACLVAVALCAVLAAGAVGARAAAGDSPPLAFSGCVGDRNGCVTTHGASGALDGAVAVAVSPDGKQIYAVGNSDYGALSHFRVDATGRLSFAGCIGDSANGCRPTNPADVLGGNGTSLSGVAITPDGRQLYVAVSDNLSHFTIGAGGHLTFAGCVGPASGCSPVPFSDAATGASPLNGVQSLVISPDGHQLYSGAASTSMSSSGANVTTDALSHFTIDHVGNLAFAGCVGDLPGCAPTSPAGVLAAVAAMTVGRDGSQLYAASKNSVSHFTLDGSGNPTFSGCVGDFAGCVATNPAAALNGASAVAVTPDGKQLFAAGSDANAVSRLSLSASGAPTFSDCLGDQAGCTATHPGGALQGASALAFTRDGRRLYVASNAGNTVSEVTLGSSGAASFTACIGRRGGCIPIRPRAALDGATDLAFAPDGQHLYVTAAFDLSVLARPVQTLTAVGGPRQRGRTVALKLTCQGPGAGPCTGAVTLSRGKQRVGSASVRLTAGHSTVLRVALNRTGRRLLAHHARLTVTLTVTQQRAGRPVTVATDRLTLTRR